MKKLSSSLHFPLYRRYLKLIMLLFSIFQSVNIIKVWDVNTHNARKLSSKLDLLKDVYEPKNETDVPLFWHIAGSSGSTLKHVLSSCYNLKRPQPVNSESERSLKVFGSFVNLDTSSPEGIERAAELGLVSSGLADVITSDQIHLVQSLFDINHRPIMFTLIRHPFYRLHSYFNFMKGAEWAKHHDSFSARFGNLTFLEYLERKRGVHHNILATSLTNVPNSQLNDEHVHLATEILNKSLIGLTIELETSIQRFQQYFGWSKTNHSQTCMEKLVKHDPEDPYNYETSFLLEDSKIWNLLKKKEKYDLQIYENAKKIFEFQGRKLF